MEGFHAARVWSRDRDVVPYHVFWIVPDMFEESFRENTGQRFCDACLEFARRAHGPFLDSGVEFDRELREWCVRLQVRPHVRIEDVTASLQLQYERHWAANRVPKLKVLVQDALRSRRVMADAVCRHMLAHGHGSTQLALAVLFG